MIKDRIKAGRLRLGLTLEDVAKKVGTTKQTVQKYESGVITAIPSSKIELLADALETTPAALMGWDNAYENEISDLVKDPRNAAILQLYPQLTVPEQKMIRAQIEWMLNNR